MSIAYSALIKILGIETTLKMTTRFMIPIDKRILILKPCFNIGEHYLGMVVHIPVITELTRLAQVDPPSSRNTWVSDRASIDWKIPTKPSILPNFNMTTYILWKNLKHQQYTYDISIPITITSQTKTCLMPVTLINNRCLNIILKLKNLNLEMVHFYNPSSWEIDWEFKSASVT